MSPTTRWEYNTLTDNATPEAFDELGREGWEAVGFANGFWLFKRPLPEPAQCEWCSTGGRCTLADGHEGECVFPPYAPPIQPIPYRKQGATC